MNHFAYNSPNRLINFSTFRELIISWQGVSFRRFYKTHIALEYLYTIYSTHKLLVRRLDTPLSYAHAKCADLSTLVAALL